MKIVEDTKLDFDDILLVPARSPAASRKEVNLERSFKFFHSSKEWQGFPIMAANMDTTGTLNMGIALSKHNAITCLHKHYGSDFFFFDSCEAEENIWVSIGMNENEIFKVKDISKGLYNSPNICIDVANGYTEKFVKWCAKIRENFPNSIIMAGNVCTPEMVQELILHGGADIVKIGIGPGSACTTRLKTGCGYPQLSAIIECSHAAHGLKSEDKRMGLICADGGCRLPADVCKAFAANADFVMLGGMLAGTEECEGEWEYERDLDAVMVKKNLSFYGMSSEKAQEKYRGGMANYVCSEGRVKKIPYKGSVDIIINDIQGGLRSCCAYVGATCLKDLPKCAKAVKVNRVHYDNKV